EELRRAWPELLREAAVQIRTLLGLPQRVDALLTRAERGGLTLQTGLSPDARRAVQRLERSHPPLGWVLIAPPVLGAPRARPPAADRAPWTWSFFAGGALASLYGAGMKR